VIRNCPLHFGQTSRSTSWIFRISLAQFFRHFSLMSLEDAWHEAVLVLPVPFASANITVVSIVADHLLSLDRGRENTWPPAIPGRQRPSAPRRPSIGRQLFRLPLRSSSAAGKKMPGRHSELGSPERRGGSKSLAWGLVLCGRVSVTPDPRWQVYNPGQGGGA
jgi:hypothetical protein